MTSSKDNNYMHDNFNITERKTKNLKKQILQNKQEKITFCYESRNKVIKISLIKFRSV